MIDCSRCIHYEVCSNRFSNDGCEGTCGFYLQDIRLQGEWKNAGFMVCECNNCKEQFHELEANNYCPNCGADMRKDGEEE